MNKMESLLYRVVFGIFPKFSEPEPVFADSHWLSEETKTGDSYLLNNQESKINSNCP